MEIRSGQKKSKYREKWAIFRSWLGDVWKQREREIMWWLATLLVGIIAFEAGFLQGKAYQDPPLIIEKPAAQSDGQSDQKSCSNEPASLSTKQDTSSSGSVAIPKDCRFVGSKNSDKYHLSSCAVAKRIKPENRVCFASEDDARAKGYKAGCLK